MTKLQSQGHWCPEVMPCFITPVMQLHWFPSCRTSASWNSYWAEAAHEIGRKWTSGAKVDESASQLASQAERERESWSAAASRRQKVHLSIQLARKHPSRSKLLKVLHHCCQQQFPSCHLTISSGLFVALHCPLLSHEPVMGCVHPCGCSGFLSFPDWHILNTLL